MIVSVIASSSLFWLLGHVPILDAQVPPHLFVPCLEPGDAGYFESSSPEWSWSPTGDSIVLDRAMGDASQLLIVDLNTGERRCLTSGEEWDVHPSWSPDGRTVAFVRGRVGSEQIRLLSLRDGSVEALTPPSERSIYPTFSPDGTRIAYVRYDREDSRRRFVIVHVRATGEERIVFTSPFGLNNLAWTPDGSAVLLYSIASDGWNDLYEAAADGSGVRRVTDNTVTDTYSAAYSADGSKMVFGQGAERSSFHRWFNYDLFEQDVESGATRRLTWAYGADDRARFSPDGTRIGFVSRRSGYPELYIMSADGTNLRQVTTQPRTELAGVVEREGLDAGLALLDGIRATDAGAVLIGDRAASVLVHRYLARGAVEAALAVARVGAEAHPDSPWILTALGRAHLAAGDRAGALIAFRSSLELEPNQAQVATDIGLDDFLGILDSIGGVYVDRGSDVLQLSGVLRDRGALYASIAILGRLARAHPEDPDVLEGLADTQMSLGDHPSATLNYRRALRADPERAWALRHIRRIGEVGAVQGPSGILEPAAPDENHWGPAWSPDGERLAYSANVDGDFELFVVDLRTRETLRLTSNESADWRPDWSPDGRRILFSSDRDGDLDLYTMDADGSNVRRILDTGANEDRARFSPDGERIVFDSDRSGSWGVYVVNRDGTNLTNAFDEQGFDGYPAWAPDGMKIVLNSDAHAADAEGSDRELYVVSLADGSRTRLTHNEGNDQAADWSASSDRIVFFSQQDGNPEIYSIEPDGSDLQRLTSNQEWDFMPRWDPTGRRIAFDSRRDGRRGIWLMNADGSGPEKITNVELSHFVRVARERSVGEALARLHRSMEWNPLVPWYLPEEIVPLARDLSDRGDVDSARSVRALLPSGER